MSPNNEALEYKSDWASCPVDVLLAVFKKLDIKSLLNCMNVNVHWRNIVEYYCEFYEILNRTSNIICQILDKSRCYFEEVHHNEGTRSLIRYNPQQRVRNVKHVEHVNLWKVMVQNTMDDEGIALSEKSKLGWQELFLTSQSWLNVRNVNVYLRHCYKFDSGVRSICVHKDNLMVLTKNAVKYFNIKNFELIKVLDKSCIKYEETSSMIGELSLTPVSIELTLTNKLYTNCVGSENSKKVTHYLEDIDKFKVHLNSCYIYRDKVLWVHTAKETGWENKAVAKYHGTHKFSNIHIFNKNVYILLHSGNVVILDLECKLLSKVFNFNIPNCYRYSKPFMFHFHSLLFKAPMPDGQCVLSHERKHEYFVVAMARYGVTCVLEHGHALIIGFKDGTIDIYLTRKLVTAPSDQELPEVRLNLKTYFGKADQSESSHIASVDIYEDITGHHLFVSTITNVYELLLQL